jgi:transcription elongation GreA/GreB family factor
VIDKKEVLTLLRAKLDADLRSFTASQGAAQAGATHEETRQEDPKDTRAIEATYLARGLAERVEMIRDAVAVFSRLVPVDFDPEDPIAVTALVGLEHKSGEESVYFLVPSAGGETLVLDGTTIRTLTPGSPLGGVLIGKKVDDEVELNLPGKRLAARIAWTH